MKLYPQNRRFCVTAQGYIGLVPGMTEKGDEVCAVAGSKPLYVIRKIHDGYELIGDASVLEMMKGEAMWDPDFDIGDIKLY